MSREEKTSLRLSDCKDGFSRRLFKATLKGFNYVQIETIESHLYKASHCLTAVGPGSHDYFPFRWWSKWCKHDSSCRYWDWNIWTGRHAGISAFNSSCYFLTLSFILIGELRNSPSVLEELLKSFAEFSSERQGASLPIHNLYHHIPTGQSFRIEIKRCLAFYRQLTIPVC